MCAHEYMHVQGLLWASSSIAFLLIFWNRVSHWTWNLPNWLAIWIVAPAISRAPHCQDLDFKHAHVHTITPWFLSTKYMLGIQTQVFSLVKVLYKMSSLPGHLFYMRCICLYLRYIFYVYIKDMCIYLYLIYLG